MITSLDETRSFQKVAEVLSRRGWAEASAGNMSLRLENGAALAAQTAGTTLASKADMSDLEGRVFLVTASGSRMRDLACDPAAALVLVRVLAPRRLLLLAGSGPLTSEWPTHARLHAQLAARNDDQRAILHCHPLNLIAVSHLFASEAEMNDRLLRMHHETRLFLPEGLGWIPYAVTGSDELAEATRRKLDRSRVALWDKHGAIAVGRNLDEALDRIEMVDKAAAIYLLLRSAGVEPSGLSDGQLDATGGRRRP